MLGGSVVHDYLLISFTIPSTREAKTEKEHPRCVLRGGVFLLILTPIIVLLPGRAATRRAGSAG